MKPPYEQSIAILKERVEIIGEMLGSLDRRPQHDDEVLGPSIFRMLVKDVSLDGLTLPSSFKGCVFEGAITRGTRLYRPPKRFGLWREPGQQSLPLSADQRAEIAWCEDAPEPGGG